MPDFTLAEIQVIFATFDMLVAEIGAVSDQHRRSIGERLIVAAREGVLDPVSLADRVRGAPHPEGQGPTDAHSSTVKLGP